MSFNGKIVFFRALVFLFGITVAAQCLAQSSPVTPESEFQKKIKVSQDVEPLGEHPFGESISLYNGGLSFDQVDVTASGTGPTIEVSRSFHTPDQPPGGVYYDFIDNAFVDWALDTPRIETLSAASGTGNSVPPDTAAWFFISDTNRCSQATTAPDEYVTFKGTVITYSNDQWWHGYQLIMPGSGSQEVLMRDASNTQVPNMTDSGGAAISFPLVTKEHWAIGCLSSTSNGKPGQGFLAVAPDGTRYYLDVLLYKTTDSMIFGGGGALHRRIASMAVSKVVDRFGNTVNYTYDANGNLTNIVASDGRAVQINYETWQNPAKDQFGNYYDPPGYRVHSVVLQPTSAQPRTWTYTYSSDPVVPRLTNVTLPNNSQWTFNLGTIAPAPGDGYLITNNGCDYTLHPADGTVSSGSITHPSGLTGTFYVQGIIRGRSMVPYVCLNMGGSPAATFATRFPAVYKSNALVEKVLSGAGITTQTWTYTYSAPNDSWDSCSGCATTVTTDMVDPALRTTRYTFSNKFDTSESMLLRTDYYNGDSSTAIARSEANTYALPPATGWPWPWPQYEGRSPVLAVNTGQTGQLAPLSQAVTTDTGNTFTRLVNSFDTFANPASVTRSSNVAGQVAITETTSYLNDQANWVLGLPVETDNVSTGEVENHNTYNTGTDTLASRARFGQTLMSYGWNTAGQLASFTDPLNHTTTLGNYKRGIPQSIGFPDSTSESLVVDDFGQISSITNQAGNTTSYLYDSIGRIAEIDYPTGDSVAWAKQTFTYSFETWVSHGIAANHWLRGVTQGPKVTYTYFDALMRPIELLTRRSSDGGTPKTSRTDYDFHGNKTFQSYLIEGNLDLSGLTAGVTTNYDALSRVTSTMQPSELGNLTTTTNYLSGARKQVIDPKGNSTTTSYQVFDEPSYDNVIQVSAPEGVTQTITRDLYGNPLAISQGGITKSMVYDSFHRLCRTTEPESGSEVMAYDAANNLAWSASGQAITGTDCGQTQVATAAQTVRGYDAMNRVTAITYPAGTDATAMTYTLTGKPLTATSGAVSWTYGYNKLDLLTAEGLSVDGYTWALGYGYDVNGVLASTVYPDGKAVTYSPDFLGRPTTAGSYAAGAAYYPDGDLQGFTFGSGAAYTAAENSRNLLSSFSYGTGSAVAVSEDLAYDGNANITQVCDVATSTKPCSDPTNDGLRTKTLGYDGLNRLTSANAANLWGTESYTYDTLNNIRTLTTAGVTNTYNYDASNRLASVTNGATTVSSFGYDTRGNVTLRNSTPMVFDEANRLTQITGLDTYTYDAQGRRVKKTPASGSPTYYAYNQAGQLMWQYDPATTNGTDYIYLGKKMVASTVKADTTVIGNIDGVTTGTTATVTGWACSTGLPQSIQVGLYEGPAGTGANIAFVVANQSSEPAVNALCKSTGTAYRFSAVLSDSVRQTYPGQPIYGYGASPVGNGDNMLTQSGVFTIPPSASAPPAPAVLNASAAADFNSINLSWSSSATATSYSLQMGYNGGAWATYYNGPATSLNAPVSADGTYAWRVEACNTNGCSLFTAGPTVSIIHTPTVPTAISVPATSSGPIAIGWSTTTFQTFYSLEQSFNGGAFAAIYNGAANAFSYTATSTGTYTYRVRACNASVCGGYGPTGSSTITIPPTQAPNIAVPATSNTGSYTVNWGGFAGMTSYVMQEQVNGGGWTTIANNGSGTLNISGKGNGTYGYRVQGCNAGGCGPFSGTATIVVVLIPPVPTGLAWTQTGSNTKKTVHLSWNASSTATSYQLEETRTPSGGVPPTIVYNGPGLTYQTLLLISATLQYRVKACNASGCSAFSAYVVTDIVNGN